MRILMTDSHRTYGITEYMVDTLEDLEIIPKNNEGDTCYICNTGEYKILAMINNELKWVDFLTELTLLND